MRTPASAATRERILEAATRVFAERGFSGARVRGIAGEAKANVATLSYHFGDKRGLYMAVVERHFEQVQRLGERLGPTPGSDWIPEAVELIYDHLCAHRDGLRVLQRHALDADSLDLPLQSLTLDRFAPAAALLLGMPEVDARLTLNSLSFVFSRYAVAPRETERLTGLSDPEARRAQVLRHLVDLSRRVLHGSSSASAS